MKLIHLTTKKLRFPSADKIYIMNLAEVFNTILGKDYQLVVASKLPEQLSSVNVFDLQLKEFFKNPKIVFFYPLVFYFFWLPFFIRKNRLNDTQVIFFTNDVYLVILLAYWRKIFFYKYKICSDWHMLYNDRKDKSSARHSDCLIATSQKLRNLLLEKSGIDERKIKVIYGGVDLKNFQVNENENLREKLSLPADKKLVGYVGFYKTMGMRKGLDVMIKSLPTLQKDISMVFVGGDEAEIAEYQTLANRLGVAARCIFVRKVSAEVAAKYQQAMDILAIPYPNKAHFRDYGFPMKVFEYLASRKPIIYSDLDLIKEVLDGKGVAFAPDSPEDFSKKIQYIFDQKNQNEICKMTDDGYNYVLEHDWENKAQEILEFIGFKKE